MSLTTNTLPIEQDPSFIKTCSACTRLKPIQGGVLTHTSNEEKYWICAICYTEKTHRAIQQQRMSDRK